MTENKRVRPTEKQIKEEIIPWIKKHIDKEGLWLPEFDLTDKIAGEKFGCSSTSVHYMRHEALTGVDRREREKQRGAAERAKPPLIKPVFPDLSPKRTPPEQTKLDLDQTPDLLRKIVGILLHQRAQIDILLAEKMKPLTVTSKTF